MHVDKISKWLFAVMLTSVLLGSDNAYSGTKVIAEKTMTFDKCLKAIRSVATDLAVAPINIIETNQLRIVRFPTNDGSGKSILVTCSKPDKKCL